jgi:hypothetical protein
MEGFLGKRGEGLMVKRGGIDGQKVRDRWLKGGGIDGYV